MHHLVIDDERGDIADIIKLCSDSCARSYAESNGLEYGGWNGANETEFTDYCAQCGTVLPGVSTDDEGTPCKCQISNVVVNRFDSADGVKCGHGNFIQLPVSMLNRN